MDDLLVKNDVFVDSTGLSIPLFTIISAGTIAGLFAVTGQSFLKNRSSLCITGALASLFLVLLCGWVIRIVKKRLSKGHEKRIQRAAFSSAIKDLIRMRSSFVIIPLFRARTIEFSTYSGLFR